jgi:hypothetical protein
MVQPALSGHGFVNERAISCARQLSGKTTGVIILLNNRMQPLAGLVNDGRLSSDEDRPAH